MKITDFRARGLAVGVSAHGFGAARAFLAPASQAFLPMVVGRAALPRAEDPAGGPVTYIVDPNGFAILRYPPGHDPADLRSDLSRLLKLR